MANAFINNPILNSPFREPNRHFHLNEDGTPTGIINPARRPSAYVVPIPQAKKRSGRGQGELALEEGDAGTGRLSPNDFINELRGYVKAWRDLPPSQWGVTHETSRLLAHWRDAEREQPLFFCQVEAAETIIWLTEVAPRPGRLDIRKRLEAFNAEANPELFRMAMKMATGTGKTTVMAMLIAWHAVNKARHRNSKTFSDAFLIVTPGITIKDRLRVLLPSDPQNYYETRNIVPPDMLDDVRKAEIVITNYHAFKRRDTIEAPKLTKALLAGRNESFDTIESEGEMVARVCRVLMRRHNIIVINDEAHHCYRHKTGDDAAQETKLDAEEKDEAKKRAEAARIWISGVEAVKRTLGVSVVYDLSATPFFLRGSGYPENALFPWVVSDFSLMDAIESGIVKVPRVPVSDNQVGGELPVYRNLWPRIRQDLPRKGRQKQKTENLDPEKLPKELLGALHALYDHYAKVFALWKQAGQGTPPVFIIVCNNTSVSKLVYDYISGYERPEGEQTYPIAGHLPLFRNIEDGKHVVPPRTLLIDSEQLDSGEALSPEFRKVVSGEIDEFKHELRQRFPDRDTDKITDEDLLREVMNTVGKAGKLGEHLRCVVSVSMLTEGWDANTVTHILGVRAFGTQLLCEQVVGRGLRRVSYDPDDMGTPEYADILGIPFAFAAGPEIAAPKPPKPITRVYALPERAEAEIRFPRLSGYRVSLPEERLTAKFDRDAKLTITPNDVPTRTEVEAIVGEGITLTLDGLKERRESEVHFTVAGHALRTKFRDDDGNLRPHLFPDLLRITRDWFGKCVTFKGSTFPQLFLWRPFADQAVERIYNAVTRELRGTERLRPIPDSYNPEGSSRHVDFPTTKQTLWRTRADKCQINFVVCDSEWEAALAATLEAMPEVRHFVKNQSLNFTVPYVQEGGERTYLPDYIVHVTMPDGGALNLIIEVKGFRGRDAQMKAATMQNLWVPAVNNDGKFGRWAFLEIRDIHDAEKIIRNFLADLSARAAA
ncbi:MAG: BPTD_3080 family restriction endonuclease [Dongiaceae bacterium]